MLMAHALVMLKYKMILLSVQYSQNLFFFALISQSNIRYPVSSIQATCIFFDTFYSMLLLYDHLLRVTYTPHLSYMCLKWLHFSKTYCVS